MQTLNLEYVKWHCHWSGLGNIEYQTIINLIEWMLGGRNKIHDIEPDFHAKHVIMECGLVWIQSNLTACARFWHRFGPLWNVYWCLTSVSGDSLAKRHDWILICAILECTVWVLTLFVYTWSHEVVCVLINWLEWSTFNGSIDLGKVLQPHRNSYIS